MNEEMRRISNIVSDLIKGPLEGQKVTVILEDMATNKVFSDSLLKTINGAAFLLRVPRKMPPIFEEKRNLTLQQKNISNTMAEEANLFPMQHSIAVIVMSSDDVDWWPLLYPPSSWRPQSLVLLSPSTSCQKETYLLTPLLDKTPSIAVLCPHITKKATQESVPFKVWTCTPYAAIRQVVDVGIWNPSVIKTWNHLFIDRFRDMSKKNISAFANTLDAPLLYTDREDDLQGLSEDIMIALSQWLNFNLDIDFCPTVMWYDMFEALDNGEKDIFINYATITYERNVEYDVIFPYYREGFGLIMKNPPPLPQWQNVLFPFSWAVWGGVIISFVATALTYHAMYYKYEPSFVNNTLLIGQSLLSNPLDIVPVEWRARNFLMIWWLVTWFINMSYTSNLIAVLTVPVFPKKMKTVQDLVDSGKQLCMLDYGEFVDEALMESTNPTLAALGRALDMVPVIPELEAGGHEACMKKLLSGTHAHSDPYSFIKILYHRFGLADQAYSLEDQMYPGYVAFLLKKSTPWKYKFDMGIIRMIETGLRQQWYKHNMEYFKETVPPKGPQIVLQPLKIGHLQGPFLLYSMGFGFGLMTLLGEILSHKTENT